MTLQRLEQLLDAYGASPERWPADERAAALTLLAHSVEARTLRDEAERFDLLLDCAPVLSPSAELTARVLAAVPTAEAPAEGQRFHSVQLLRAKENRPTNVGQSRRRAEHPRRKPLGFVLAAAASLAIIFGGVRLLTPTPQPLSSEMIANLGRYDTPTDVLLEWPGVDSLSTLPTVGCQESEFGCPNLDALPKVESRSLMVGRRYV